MNRERKTSDCQGFLRGCAVLDGLISFPLYEESGDKKLGISGEEKGIFAADCEV